MNDTSMYSHARDVIERETADNGFSKGWGCHFLPSADYWIDTHNHIEVIEQNQYSDSLEFLELAKNSMNVRRFALILPMVRASDGLIDPNIIAGIAEIKKHKNIFPLLYIHYQDAFPALIDSAVDQGIRGVKLHNAPLIEMADDPKIWDSPQWHAMFAKIQDAGLPVLWHVTQRLTDAPYSGGRRDTYWQKGRNKGIKYTNEDLLTVFLKIADLYPDISFIGAHQLHLGWERLVEILENHPNVFVDTSVGCILQEFDSFLTNDKELLRNYFMKLQDRILFGTDTILTINNDTEDIIENYKNHIRFIRQLQLPEEPLQKISHKNCESIFHYLRGSYDIKTEF